VTSDQPTADRGASSSDPSGLPESVLRELVVCSLEPWDDVWRRNQFFVDVLLKRNPELRVLFVEPAADVLFDLWSRRVPALPRLRRISRDGRLRAFRPLKPLPRRVGRVADDVLLGQVRLAARVNGFSRPTLWINDVTYGPLISQTGWPSLYDVTDDWLLAPSPPRERERLRRLDELALAKAAEVVVCSPALAASRGGKRTVTLVPNGVDIEHFRRPQPRPVDLPTGLTAVYVGSLHDSRTDVELIVELAQARPELRIVLVGPNSLSAGAQQLLDAIPNVLLLGARPYGQVPGYLQHANIVIVPHLVSAFTESLDPIKAYECMAIGRPTVATPVAGFRDHSTVMNIVFRDSFVERVATVLAKPDSTVPHGTPTGWDERARAFEIVLVRADGRGPGHR
jgi:teichuronic acid biosynthesis glycosyltransferase TuaH